jgi:diaminohydroxyphosphoribosylaminopyrimidine deaminase/5-amino-6-(5-phosphoribosylamino)uracil reductase
LRDEDYMKLALRLARRGLGNTSPNPMVGAVIVKGGRIIGRGYHHYFGGNHAEVDAIKHSVEDVTGATMYVNMEPCFHYGKTPPCVDAVINNKITKVVIGMQDPDLRVNGKSIDKLKRASIETVVGVLEEECQVMNEAYIKHRSTGIPFVTVKFAQTLDGRIAATDGSSRWIASPESLKLAHRLRATHDAILAGVNNVLIDNPELTLRLVKGRSPTRIILDSKLRIPLEAKVLQEQEKAPTIIATTPAADDDKLAVLRERGIEVIIVATDLQGGVDLGRLLSTLGERDTTSILVEGGSRVITSFIRCNLVDRLVVIVAPKILGKGLESIGDLDIENINQALSLSFEKTYRLGNDFVVEAKINPDDTTRTS